MVVWATEREAMRPLLEKLGYVFRDRGFRAQLDFTRDDVKLSLIFLERHNGDLTPQNCPGLVWLPDALGGVQTLHGLTCRTLTPQQLIHEKRTYEGNQALRVKDIESLRLLESLVSG